MDHPERRRGSPGWRRGLPTATLPQRDPATLVPPARPASSIRKCNGEKSGSRMRATRPSGSAGGTGPRRSGRFTDRHWPERASNRYWCYGYRRQGPYLPTQNQQATFPQIISRGVLAGPREPVTAPQGEPVRRIAKRAGGANRPRKVRCRCQEEVGLGLPKRDKVTYTPSILRSAGLRARPRRTPGG